MARPEIGLPLTRAADAYTDQQKWDGYVLADRGHGVDWRRAFGAVESGDLWLMVARSVRTAPVSELRDLGELGVTCRVEATLTVNERTALVRTIWHYEHLESAPRLVTAYPIT